jgi:hypothetical protein
MKIYLVHLLGTFIYSLKKMHGTENLKPILFQNQIKYEAQSKVFTNPLFSNIKDYCNGLNG